MLYLPLIGGGRLLTSGGRLLERLEHAFHLGCWKQKQEEEIHQLPADDSRLCGKAQSRHTVATAEGGNEACSPPGLSVKVSYGVYIQERHPRNLKDRGACFQGESTFQENTFQAPETLLQLVASLCSDVLNDAACGGFPARRWTAQCLDDLVSLAPQWLLGTQSPHPFPNIGG